MALFHKSGFVIAPSQSMSFDTLINLLRFLVQKLWIYN